MADNATASNVTASKPKIAGAIYRAPIGTALPTDAKTNLNEAFKNLGFVSEDGITNGRGLDSTSIKAFGGAIVLSTTTVSEDTFQFTLIEFLNTDTKKAVYGDDNVKGDLTNGITLTVNNVEPGKSAWVIDLILRNNVLHRIVIPCASVTEIGDISYKDDELAGYETTLTAELDDNSNTHYEYTVKAGTTTD